MYCKAERTVRLEHIENARTTAVRENYSGKSSLSVKTKRV